MGQKQSRSVQGSTPVAPLQDVSQGLPVTSTEAEAVPVPEMYPVKESTLEAIIEARNEMLNIEVQHSRIRRQALLLQQQEQTLLQEFAARVAAQEKAARQAFRRAGVEPTDDYYIDLDTCSIRRRVRTV